jgi:hypothetical protein
MKRKNPAVSISVEDKLQRSLRVPVGGGNPCGFLLSRQ